MAPNCGFIFIPRPNEGIAEQFITPNNMHEFGIQKLERHLGTGVTIEYYKAIPYEDAL